MTLKNNRAPLLCYFKLCFSFHNHLSIQNGVKVRKRQIRVKIDNFFCPCDLEIWWLTLKNYRAPLLCYFKLCATFHSHLSIQNGVTVRKRPNWVKIGDFLSRVPLKFDGWPWKTIGTFSMLLQVLCIISWPLLNSNWSYSPETPNLGQIRCFFEPCDLEIWWLTLNKE